MDISSLMNGEDNLTWTDDVSADQRFQIVTWRWESVQTVATPLIWLLVAVFAKAVFHRTRCLTGWIPDSTLLVILGVAVGFVLQALNVPRSVFTLDSHAFFVVLLPPIIFDAGYFMPKRAFLENIPSIAILAVIVTVWNCFAMGGVLWWMASAGLFPHGMEAVHLFLFTSLISACDPVAVIAVFEEININDFLFTNVFGEALFNDAISVVLYNLFASILTMGAENLQFVDIVFCIISFFVVSIGGILLGIAFATVTSILTRFSNGKWNPRTNNISPVFAYILPLLSYLTAEMLSLSPIITTSICGIAMKAYVKRNVLPEDELAFKYFTKVVSQSSEAVIYLFLGLAVAAVPLEWQTLFVLCSVAFSFVFRIIAVLPLCALMNRFGKRKFSAADQIVLCYSGLRGAIAFGLVVALPEIPAKPLFTTAVLAIVYFNVLVQGVTIAPLVKFLRIETKHWDKFREEEGVRKECTIKKISPGQGKRRIGNDMCSKIHEKCLLPIMTTRKRGEKEEDEVGGYVTISLFERRSRQWQIGGTTRLDILLDDLRRIVETEWRHHYLSIEYRNHENHVEGESTQSMEESPSNTPSG